MTSNQIVNDQTAPSVEGTSLRLNTYASTTGAVTVNGKRVVNADVRADNGVVHVIDEVSHVLYLGINDKS